jgi:hypothetical protein
MFGRGYMASASSVYVGGELQRGEFTEDLMEQAGEMANKRHFRAVKPSALEDWQYEETTQQTPGIYETLPPFFGSGQPGIPRRLLPPRAAEEDELVQEMMATRMAGRERARTREERATRGLLLPPWGEEPEALQSALAREQRLEREAQLEDEKQAEEQELEQEQEEEIERERERERQFEARARESERQRSRAFQEFSVPEPTGGVLYRTGEGGRTRTRRPWHHF